MPARPTTHRSFGLRAALSLLLLAGTAGEARAHSDSAASLPLKPRTLRLQHRRPAEIVALFAREQLPGPDGQAPRAARMDGAESLLPGGTEAIYRTRSGEELVLVTMEGAAEIEACIRGLDVPVQALGPDREKVVVTLRRAPAARMRAAVLRLPEAGTAAVEGRRLTLTGKPAWIHRALRSVIRAELGLR